MAFGAPRSPEGHAEHLLFELFEPDRPKSTTLDNAEPLKPLLNKHVADLCGRSALESDDIFRVPGPNPASLYQLGKLMFGENEFSGKNLSAYFENLIPIVIRQLLGRQPLGFLK